MANEVDIELTGDARDLEKAIDKSNRKIGKFESGVKKAGRSIRSFRAQASGTFSKIGVGLTGALAVGRLIRSGKAIANFNLRLIRLGNQANISSKEALGLRQELFNISKETGRAPTELLAGIEAIVEKTGNLKFAVESIRDMSKVAVAAGADVNIIGSAASDLQEKMDIASGDITSVFDILAAQGKQGAFTLQNMARLFGRLLSAAGRFNIKGIEGVRKFGAFLQIARRGTGTSEQAATAVERTIADIIAKRKQIAEVTGGFDIVDVEKSRKANKLVLKDFDIVLKEIIRKTKGNVFELQQIFGEESIRAITPLAESFKKFGDFREFDAFIGLGGDGVAIMKDFKNVTRSTAFQAKALGVEFDNTLQETVLEVLPEVNELLRKTNKLLKGMDKEEKFTVLAGSAGLLLTKLLGIKTTLGFLSGGAGFKLGKEVITRTLGSIEESKVLQKKPARRFPSLFDPKSIQLSPDLKTFFGIQEESARATRQAVPPFAKSQPVRQGPSISDLLRESFSLENNITINLRPDGTLESVDTDNLRTTNNVESGGVFSPATP